MPALRPGNVSQLGLPSTGRLPSTISATLSIRRRSLRLNAAGQETVMSMAVDGVESPFS